MDKRLFKKCIKCREIKAKETHIDADGIEHQKGFGAHNSSDGYQSICFACKNIANNKARDKNVSSRLRHHTATRCLTQLGKCAPPTLTQDLEHYLGYRIRALVKALGQDLKEREGSHRKLREALNEGYHIDHKRPLSSFRVLCDDVPGGVDWGQFRECWAITNLTAIPAAENLAKGAKYDEADSLTPKP